MIFLISLYSHRKILEDYLGLLHVFDPLTRKSNAECPRYEEDEVSGFCYALNGSCSTAASSEVVECCKKRLSSGKRTR